MALPAAALEGLPVGPGTPVLAAERALVRAVDDPGRGAPRRRLQTRVCLLAVTEEFVDAVTPYDTDDGELAL
eukprot:2588044-Lingulodinium_polyedra.AAC.1